MGTLRTSAGTEIVVKVLAFARLREVLGFSERSEHFPEGTTVGDAWAAIARDSPEARALRGALRIARNGEIAGDEAILASGDELALLPPVSGG